MNQLELIKELVVGSDTKIVMLVLDGLGGLPKQPGGPTELEFAKTPNMDRLALEGMTGLSIPIVPGIAPGSGPGHLALFGYDPLQYQIGRGVLETIGIGFCLQNDDVAARGNFCTVDDDMVIIDRRAGRIPTSKCRELVERLRSIRLDDIEVFVEAVQDYRFALVLRGNELSPLINETDPQRTGERPLKAEAQSPEAERTAKLVNTWVTEARRILQDEEAANMVTLRGWSRLPKIPKFPDIYGLRAAAIAVYPMYKGLAGLVGMEVIDGCRNLQEQLKALEENWERYDFFFLHYKYTDSRGEDGQFEAKAAEIEKVDRVIPEIVGLRPDVLIITGDHSTPTVWKAHSWHPVPTILWAPGLTRSDESRAFGETECLKGAMGQFAAKGLMAMALSHARRTMKFGA